MYSTEDKHWNNVNFEDLLFIGATQNSNGISGFVPPPEKNQLNLFLRSDGTWASIAGNDIYEADIEDLRSKFNSLSTLLGTPKDDVNNSSGLYAELDKKVDKTEVFTKEETEAKINEKVIASQHLQRKIVSSVEDIDLTANDVEQYIYLIPSGLEEEFDKYYEYLVIKNLFGEKVIEKVGAWETNFSNYFTKDEVSTLLDTKLNKVEDSRLMTNDEGNKLNLLLNIQSIDGTLSFQNNQLSVGQIPTNKVANLNDLISTVSEIVDKVENNYISSVSKEFIVENGKLSLKEISISEVANLSTLLEEKADNSRMEVLEQDVEDIKLALTWTTI